MTALDYKVWISRSFQWTFISAFLFLITFFINPICFFILFLMILSKFKLKPLQLTWIFTVMNLLIVISFIISIVFWTVGISDQLTFAAALYNIFRWEWVYLIPLWSIFLVIGIVTIIRLRTSWEFSIS